MASTTNRGNRRGATVIEIVVVIAVILIVTAFLFPMLGRAMRHSHGAVDIEHLKELGVAASVYTDTHESVPLSVLDFQDTNVWESEIWSSANDPYRNGFRNELMSKMGDSASSLTRSYAARVVPFKVSFIGLADFFPDIRALREKSLTKGSGGWLISFCGQNLGALREPLHAADGEFTRLNFDGSVVHRKSQKYGGQLSFTWLFADTDKDEKALGLD